MKIHTIKGYIQTTYVIEYPDKILVFDSGCRPDYFKIKKFVEFELQRQMNEIKLVAVSHAHPDHLGSASLFLKHHNIPIATTVDTLKWYTGFSGFITYLIDVFLTYYVSYRLKKSLRVNLFFHPFPKVQHLLYEGTSLPNFDDWCVIKTPGHTPSDICFYHQSTKTIYVADMVIKKRGEFILPYPIYEPDLFKKSLQEIQMLDSKVLLLAHYGPIHFNQQDYQNLLSKIPTYPRVHSNFITKRIRKLKKIFSKYEY